MPEHTAQQFKGFEDWIQVFETGTHTDSAGHTRHWSREDLQSMVANHDTAHPAPLVVGHPKTDDPRYGQVSAYRLDADGKLWFKGGNIEPTFEEMVNNQQFPERSIAIDGDGAGGYKVRHIGFLGAVPPALKLTPMQYGLPGTATYEYAGRFGADVRTPSTLVRILGRLREFVIDKFDMETADQVLPHWEVDSLKAHAIELNAGDGQSNTSPYFSQPTGETTMPVTDDGRQKTEDSKAFTQADIDAAVEQATKDNTTLQKQLDDERRTRLRGEYQAQIDQAITEGRLTPAQSEGLVEFMLVLPDGADAPFTFISRDGVYARQSSGTIAATRGEGDKAEQVKQTPMQFFEGFISRLGRQLDLSTEQGGTDTAPDETSTASFTLADDKAVIDAERLALHNKALAYQKQNPNTPYIAAVQAVGG